MEKIITYVNEMVKVIYFKDFESQQFLSKVYKSFILLTGVK